jgi:hypothetical protein
MTDKRFHTLREMEGGEIVALIPFFHHTTLQRLKLHKVEEFGIWVESQMSTNDLLKMFGQTSSPRTMIYFFPWHQITTILTGIDSLALSEKALGL